MSTPEDPGMGQQGPPGAGPGGVGPGGPAPGGQAPGAYPPQGGYQPQGYPPQGGYAPGGQGPGVGDRASQAAQTVARHVKTPETKEFFKTSEFLVWLLTVAGVLIAGAIVGEGDGGGDDFPASLAWSLVTALSFAYIISRGISKAGTRRGYGEAPMDRGGQGGY